MRLIYLCSNLLPANAGDAIVSQSILKRLSSVHELTLLAFGEDSQFNNSILANAGVEVVLFKRPNSNFNKLFRFLLLGSINQVFSLRYLSYAMRLMKHNDYDLVVVDHLRVYCLYRLTKFFLKKRCPSYVYIAHNDEIGRAHV